MNNVKLLHILDNDFLSLSGLRLDDGNIITCAKDSDQVLLHTFPFTQAYISREHFRKLVLVQCVKYNLLSLDVLKEIYTYLL